MFDRLNRTLRDERGLSALETAIVLIAFVVVASVFAFTMLSAGMFSTERSKEAVYAGLSEVRGSMELRGSIVAKANISGTAVNELVFTVSNVAGGEAIDLTDTAGNNKVVIDYRDALQVASGLDWSVAWLVGDADDMLEEGELAEITITGLATTLTDPLTTSTPFALEVKPPKGSVLLLERRTPDAIDTYMDLM